MYIRFVRGNIILNIALSLSSLSPSQIKTENPHFAEHTSCANLQKLRINATFHSAKVIKVFKIFLGGM